MIYIFTNLIHVHMFKKYQPPFESLDDKPLWDLGDNVEVEVVDLVALLLYKIEPAKDTWTCKHVM